MPFPMVIVDYDPRWPFMYDQEKLRILGVIGHEPVGIEHIGSTAVPGLGAKPIIDIMIAVRRLSQGEMWVETLASIGYEHIPYPDFPERMFFRDGPMGDGPHHLHATGFKSDFWQEKPLFRDYLLDHIDAAQEYYSLKKELAAKYGMDREKYEPYTEAKTGFIESVLSKSRAKPEIS